MHMYVSVHKDIKILYINNLFLTNNYIFLRINIFCIIVK